MSLFRSRAKILGHISRNDISIPRSASAKSEKSRLNQSIPEICIKNAGETQDTEVQKAQVTPSRSLFSLFRKEGSTVPETTANTITKEKKDESWLIKLFTKQPRPMTPQRKSMMESREIQKKQEVGYVKLLKPEWKPSIEVITENNYIPKSQLTINSDPPPTSQPVPPPSVETRLMELQKRHTTNPQYSEKEVDMHKYVIKLPYAEFKPQKKEIPEQFKIEKFDDKRSPNINTSDVSDRIRSTSAHGHRRIDRKFSWYTQQTVERTEPTFANIQPNKALMHTDRKTIQYFTHRNYIEPHRHGKIRGHSLQLQINNRKHMLTQIQNKIPTTVLPVAESSTQEQPAKEDISPKISKLSSAHFTSESLAHIPKLTKENSNKISIKSLRYQFDKNSKALDKARKNDGLKVRPQHQLLKTTQEMFSKPVSPKDEKVTTSIKQLNIQDNEKRHIHNYPKTNGSILWDTSSSSQHGNIDFIGVTSNKLSEFTKQKVRQNEKKSNESQLKDLDKNSQLIPKVELRKWIRRIEQREQLLGYEIIGTKLLPDANEMRNKQTFSQSDIKYLNKDFTANDVLGEINKTSNHEISKVKNYKKMHGHLGSCKSAPRKKTGTTNVSNPYAKMHAFQLPVKLRTTHSSSILNADRMPGQKNELLQQKTSTTSESSKDQISKTSLKSREYLWDKVTLYTEPKVNKNDMQRKTTFKSEHQVSYPAISQAQNLQMMKNILMTSHGKITELSKKSISQSKTNINGLLTTQYIKKNNTYSSKTFVVSNKHSADFQIKSLKGQKSKYFNVKSETIINQHGNKTLQNFKSKYKSKETGAELKNKSSLTTVNELSSSSDNNILKNSLIKSLAINNYSEKDNMLPKNEDLQNKIDDTNEKLFPQNLHNKQAKSPQQTQEGQQVKLNPGITKVSHTQAENSEKTPPQLSQKSFKDNASDKCFSEKSPKIDEEPNLVANKNEYQMTEKRETCSENMLIRNLKDESNDGVDKEEKTPERENENMNKKNIESHSEKELLTKNFALNSSSGSHADLELIHETFHSESNKSLVPVEAAEQVETKNSTMNKNWTFADLAASFYGAIFSKQDMLSMDLHKAIGTNNEEWHPVILDKELKALYNTKINNTKSEQNLSEAEHSKKSEELRTETSLNKSETEDDSTVKKMFVDETSGSETTTIKNQLQTQNSEYQKELGNAEEDIEYIRQNTSEAAKTPSPPNSFTPIQCSKRHYSSYKIQEPFNFGPSSYECKGKDKCKKKKDKSKKKVDRCAGKKRKAKGKGRRSKKPKPTEYPSQLICKKKKKKSECKRLHMPGCPIPRSIKCCVDSEDRLPCIKKEAPGPSFSECMKFPLVPYRFTECDCHDKKLKKCTIAYKAPVNYDACRKKVIRKPRKKVKEEELIDDDEGEFPPC